MNKIFMVLAVLMSLALFNMPATAGGPDCEGNHCQDTHNAGDVDQGNTTTFTDDSTYEARERNPISSAAPVSAAACSSGLSAQGVDFGGAIAVTNKYCNLALVAETAAAHGLDNVSEEMVEMMADMARADTQGVFGFRQFVRGLPIFGGFLSWVW